MVCGRNGQKNVVYYSGTWIYYVFYAPYNVTVCANIGRYSRLARNGKYTEDDFNYLIEGLPNDIERIYRSGTGACPQHNENSEWIEFCGDDEKKKHVWSSSFWRIK